MNDGESSLPCGASLPVQVLTRPLPSKPRRCCSGPRRPWLGRVAERLALRRSSGRSVSPSKSASDDRRAAALRRRLGAGSAAALEKKQRAARARRGCAASPSAGRPVSRQTAFSSQPPSSTLDRLAATMFLTAISEHRRRQARVVGVRAG